MFGSIKKVMVVAAVAGVAAAAPAVASADQWWDTSVPAVFNGAAHAGGNLTLTLPNGAQTNCNVTATMDLSNPGSVATGEVESFTLTSCTTNAPNCTVTASADATTLPWHVTTSGTSVTIHDVRFTNVYSGDGCQAPPEVTAFGDVTGVADGNLVLFENAGDLMTSLGLPAVVDGYVEVYAEDGSGGPDFSRPIELA